MKKLLSILLILCLLTGCGRKPSEPPGTSGSPEEALFPPIPDQPRESDVLNLYAAASVVYNWFDLTSMPYAEADSRQENGLTYYRVEGDKLTWPVLFVPELHDSYLPYAAAGSVTTLAELQACMEQYLHNKCVSKAKGYL